MRPTNLVALAVVSGVVAVAGSLPARGRTPPVQEKSRPATTAPPLEVTFREPTVGDRPRLLLVPRAKLPGVVRVVRVGKVEPQERILICFVRERDGAYAGQFDSERKQIGPDTFEYRAELTAPAGAGRYELVARLDRTRLPDPRPGASIKVEVVQ